MEISLQEFEDATDYFINNLFTFDNSNCSRRTYNYIMIPLMILEYIIEINFIKLGMFLGLAFVIFEFCLVARRSNSCDFVRNNPQYNKWLSLLTLIPVVGTVYDILLMFVRNNVRKEL